MIDFVVYIVNKRRNGIAVRFKLTTNGSTFVITLEVLSRAERSRGEKLRFDERVKICLIPAIECIKREDL